MTQNIVNLLGAGSGIDTLALVDQLVEVEKSPTQNRIDSKRESFETQLSDFGLLRSALSNLQDAGEQLSNTDTFNTKSASFTDSDVLVPTAIDADALVGEYSFEVTALAKAQSLSTEASFSAPSDEVGTGTITFSFGSWNVVTPPADPTTFTRDTDVDQVTVTIDENNNSLAGLAKAINETNSGIQARVVNDGSGYRLLISAESGANNQLEITVSEDGGTPTNTDNTGLSRFAFNASAFQLTQNQIGQDAALTVNGLSITRETNSIDDVIDGLEFSINKASPGEIVNISISEDTSGGEAAIRDFIETYNTFLEAIKPLIGFNDELSEFGSLKNDSIAKSMPNRIRNLLVDSVPGLNGDFTALTNIGIRTELDGTLSINDEEFSAAIDENYDLVKALFTSQSNSSSELVKINGFNGFAESGEYEIIITQDPAKGYLTGVAAAGTILTDLQTAGATDYDFTATVNGVVSGTISLTPGTYSSMDDLAAHIQEQINADSSLSALNADVIVSYDSLSGGFVITSDKYGASSSVAVTAVGTSAGDLGLAAGTSTAGLNVAGTVDGVEGFGSGNIFLPKLNTDAYGISFTIEEGAAAATASTPTTINLSRGFGGELSRLIDTFLANSGAIDAREDAINQDLDDLDEDQENLDRRIEIYRERMSSQFIAMEAIVRSLQDSSAFLESTLSNLLNMGRDDN